MITQTLCNYISLDIQGAQLGGAQRIVHLRARGKGRASLARSSFCVASAQRTVYENITITS